MLYSTCDIRSCNRPVYVYTAKTDQDLCKEHGDQLSEDEKIPVRPRIDPDAIPAYPACPVCESDPADVSWQTAGNQHVCANPECAIVSWVADE